MPIRPIAALRALAFARVVLALVPLGCASKPPTGGPGTYRGVLAGVTEIGTVEVTVEEAGSGLLPASGTINLASTVVSLSGTLDQSNASLSLASTDGYQLAGISRPTYVFGSFQDPQDSGSFALFLESASSSPIRLFCGSFIDTSSTGSFPSSTFPFGVTATPSGLAFCVSPGFTWFGALDASDTLSCQSGSGAFFGNTDADGGNQWGTGVDNQGNGDYGTWTLAPCGGGASDASADGRSDSGPDAGVTGSADGEVD